MNSLRRIVSLVIAVVFVASLAAPRAQAADQLLFGQTQTYTATMRADKKVVTNAKIIFTNSEDSEQKTTSFILPDGVKASALSVYQIIPPKKNGYVYDLRISPSLARSYAPGRSQP
jgi:Ni/Co efflux regulator RcnB